jgi:hypothetical protein
MTSTQEFSERMDIAESLIARVEQVGGGLLLQGRKLHVSNVKQDYPDLFNEVVRNAKAIAEYLEAFPPISETVLKEYTWLSEFAEEFARTAWRRLGALTDQEANEFYLLASSALEETTSKVEPGLGVLMAIADALTESRMEIEREAERRAARDDVPAEDWATVLELNAKRRAEKGEWRKPTKTVEVGNDLPF